MLEKPWLKNYPPGVSAEIDMNQFDSIRDIFEQSTKKFQNHIAFSNMKTSLTYRALDEKSRHFGTYLQNLPGLKKGDRVALMMPNMLQYPVALFGVLRAGFVVVNINPLYTACELEHQLKDSGAKAIVIIENFACTLQKVLQNTVLEHIVVTSLGEMHGWFKGGLLNMVLRHIKKMVPPYHLPKAISFKKALSLGGKGILEVCALSHDDLAFLQYTGGTTGTAKGAMLTHGNIVANLQQASAWLKNKLQEGSEIVITALPMYHIFCLTANILVFMKQGGHLLLITNPRDIPRFAKALQEVRFTALTGVNTLFNAMLNCPAFMALDFSHLKISLGGGAAIQRSVAERWQAQTGKPLSEAYGLTEASPAVCINPLGENFNGSIGLPVPSTDISIRNDDFQEMPLGQSGELCVKGPQVMRGYWNRPRETAQTLTSDGWLKTGDIARIDENGYVYITDRKKDMVLVSGFNVYPNEIEGVLGLHPGILESAAVGIPDAKTGEAVKVFIVTKGAALTTEDVLAHCRLHMTSYKIPRHVEFRAELPKSPVGKVLRRILRDETLLIS